MQTEVARECYVISVHHTLREDRYITFWRPNDRGYCWALSNAGKYSEDEVRAALGYYNNGSANIAVPCAVAEAMGVSPIPGHHDNDAAPCVENTLSNWRKLIKATPWVPGCNPKPTPFRKTRRR